MPPAAAAPPAVFWLMIARARFDDRSSVRVRPRAEASVAGVLGPNSRVHVLCPQHGGKPVPDPTIH